jgi:hypothetical protein
MIPTGDCEEWLRLRLGGFSPRPEVRINASSNRIHLAFGSRSIVVFNRFEPEFLPGFRAEPIQSRVIVLNRFPKSLPKIAAYFDLFRRMPN